MKKFCKSILSFMFVCLFLFGVTFLVDFKKEAETAYATDEQSVAYFDTGASTFYAVEEYASKTRGVIVIQSGSTYTMVGGTMNGQSSRFGSSFYVENGATLELKGGSIENNSAKYGVIYVEVGGTLKITGDFSFKNNTTEGSNIVSGEQTLPIYMEDVSNLVISDGINITAEENTSAVYDVEIIYNLDGEPSTRTYVDLDKTFDDAVQPFDLDSFNGYFTDDMYLDVLETEGTLFEEFNTGLINLYTKTATSLYFTYTLSNGTYKATANSSATGEVVLPATHEGVAVTSFDCSLKTNITGLVLGANINTYEQYNVAGTEIKVLNLTNKVATINNYGSNGPGDYSTTAFKLEYINISDKNTAYADLDKNAVFDIDGNILLIGSKNSVLPETLKVIDDNAFYYSSIESIDMSNSPNLYYIGICAFSYTSIKTVTIPSSVTQLGVGVFSCCTQLTKAVLPNSLTVLPSGVFDGCTSLTTLNIPTSLTTWGYSVIHNCAIESLIFPNTLTSFGDIGCSAVKFIYWPSSVTSGFSSDNVMWPFYGCSTSLEIATDVTTAEEAVEKWGENWHCTGTSGSDYATVYYGYTYESTYSESIYQMSYDKENDYVSYYNNSSVTNSYSNEIVLVSFNGTIPSSGTLSFPKSTTIIGSQVFAENTDISTVDFTGSDVWLVGYQAFFGCSYMMNLTLSSKIKYLSDSCFGENNLLRGVSIPANVTAIFQSFYRCASLTTATFESGCTNTGAWTFTGCTSLYYASIPDSITYIGDGVFSACTSFDGGGFYVSTNISYIGMAAFGGCTSLYNVYIPDSDGLFIAGEYGGAFEGCTNLTIHTEFAQDDIPPLFEECWNYYDYYSQYEVSMDWGGYTP